MTDVPAQGNGPPLGGRPTPTHAVRSDRGALPVSPSVGFPGPPPEPDVRLVDASGSPQAPSGRRRGPHAVLGHGDGIFAPR
jgi:hypothetical protein